MLTKIFRLHSRPRFCLTSGKFPFSAMLQTHKKFEIGYLKKRYSKILIFVYDGVSSRSDIFENDNCEPINWPQEITRLSHKYSAPYRVSGYNDAKLIRWLVEKKQFTLNDGTSRKADRWFAKEMHNTGWLRSSATQNFNILTFLKLWFNLCQLKWKYV